MLTLKPLRLRLILQEGWPQNALQLASVLLSASKSVSGSASGRGLATPGQFVDQVRGKVLPAVPLLFTSVELKQRWQRWQRKRQKSARFRLAKQQLFTCIALFCTFLFRHCMTSTWNCVISRFVEDGNTSQQLSFPFSKLPYSILEFSFNSRKICHATFGELSEMKDVR